MTATELSGAAHSSAHATPRPRIISDIRAGDGVFAVGLGALLAWAAWCGRGVWFFIDEWAVITRYHDGHWFTPFNGHLSLVPIAVYRLLLATVGYNFAPYRAFGLLCYGAVAVAVFVFARARVDPLVAAIAALIVAWSSQSQLLLMFPLLFNFTLPIAALVFIWILLDRDRFSYDLVATAALAVALATSSVGLLAALTVGAELILRRETRLRRWATFAPPVVLWFIWYLRYGQGHTGAGGTIGSVASFAAHQFLATFVALAAEWKLGGVAVFAATAVIVFAAVTRWKTFDRRAAVIAITLVGFLLLSAIGRNAAGEKFHVAPVAADSERFVWIDGLLVICLVVQCLRGRRVRALGIVAGVVLLLGNAVVLGHRLGEYRTVPLANARNARTVFVAIDALGERADPARPLPLGFLPVPTRDYLGLARHYGSPAAGVSFADLGDEQTRLLADGWLLHDLGIHIETEPARGECRPLPDAAAPGGAAVAAPATVAINAGEKAVTIRIRRLAPRFDGPALGEIAPGTTALVRLPADHSKFPWYVQVDPPTARVDTCS